MLSIFLLSILRLFIALIIHNIGEVLDSNREIVADLAQHKIENIDFINLWNIVGL